MIGKVIKMVPGKSFGFIKSDENANHYFFHRSDFNGFFDDLETDFSDGLNKNIKVSFDVVVSNKGPRASNVTVIT